MFMVKGMWRVGLATLLLGSATAFAAEIDGVDADGFFTSGGVAVADNGVFDPGHQALKPGDYTITKPASPLNIVKDATGASLANPALFIDAGTNLTIVGHDAVNAGSSPGTGLGHALTVGEVWQAGGNVTITGATWTDTGEYNAAMVESGSYSLGDGNEEASLTIAGGNFGGLTVRGYFDQYDNGVLTVRAGNPEDDGGYMETYQALTVFGDAWFDGKVILQRSGGVGAGADNGRVVAAIRQTGWSGETLVFGSNSTLYLDVGGTGQLGFIEADAAIVEEGARFGLLNTSSLATGESVTHYFLRTTNEIVGDFEMIGDSSLTLSMHKADLPDDLEDGYHNLKGYEYGYGVSVTRTGDAGDFLAGATPNAKSVVAALAAISAAGADPATQVLRDIYSHFDRLGTTKEMVEFSNDLARVLSPETLVRVMDGLQTQNAAAATALHTVLSGYGFGGEGNESFSAVRSTNAMARVGQPGCVERMFFATPLGQWTHFSRPSPAFSKANDFTAGVALGFGMRQEDNFAFGASVHYQHSDLDSGTASIDTDIFGVNLYGRKYFTSNGPKWFAEGGLGYSYGDIEQERKNPLGVNRSDTDSHLFNAWLGAGVDIDLGRSTVLTPTLGLDYNHIRTEDYQERGTAAALRVNPDDYDSFQGVVGVRVKTDIGDSFFLTANAAYRHEFADRQATVRNAFVVAPAARFVTKGFEQSRSHGEFGAGFGWQPSERVSLGANYDFHLAEKQTSHSVTAMLGIKF